jgi:hypothetical protein
MLWPVRLVRSFVFALLIGAISTAWVIAAVRDGTVLAVSLLVLGLLMVAVVRQILVSERRYGGPLGSPARELPGVSTSEGIVRYGTHAEDGEDLEPGRLSGAVSQAPEKREIPYALQIANVVVGLAVGIAGVIIAVVKG